MMMPKKIWRSNFTQDLYSSTSGVPSKVYTDLINSSAVGKYFSEKVRTGWTKQMVA